MSKHTGCDAVIAGSDEAIVSKIAFSLLSAGVRVQLRNPGTILSELDELSDAGVSTIVCAGMDGAEVASELLDAQMTCVVVARVTAPEAAELLAAGAFDVIDPESDFRHLGVRIAAAAARAHAGATAGRIPQGNPETGVPGIFVDAQRHLVFIDGKPLDLAANEFRMIEELVSARGGIVTRGQLFKMVSRNAEQISHRALDSHIYGLRHKLGQYADCLQTVRGLGFRLTTPGTIHGSSESAAKSA